MSIGSRPSTHEGAGHWATQQRRSEVVVGPSVAEKLLGGEPVASDDLVQRGGQDDDECGQREVRGLRRTTVHAARAQRGVLGQQDADGEL